ncbi:hypothetical protein ATE80_08685 [Streptomyces kanasensis]|uniref:Uncharacterized protein n=1 Tax=Streptomyces kanasensis TaxID=936756 RepID=A0A117IWZ5_9ACTN|nr:hypothetical protein ATE80_08685 [Streptomyces kanasensis]
MGGHLGARVEVDGTGQVLAVDHVGELGHREPEEHEGAVRAGVVPGRELRDLEGDVRELGRLDEPVELGAHDRRARAGRPAAQHRLVHDHPELRGVETAEEGLALHAQGHVPFDVLG